MQIRTRLYLVVILSILLGVSATTFMYYGIFKNEIIKTLKAREELTIREIKANLDNKIDTVFQTMNSLRTGDEAIYFLSETDPENREPLFQIRRALRSIQDMISFPVRINIVDIDGNVRASSSGFAGNIENWEYFRTARSGYVVTTFDSLLPGPAGPLYTVAAPIHKQDTERQTVGVVLVTVSLQDLLRNDIRERYGNNETTTLALLNETGDLILWFGSRESASDDLRLHEVFPVIAREQNGDMEIGDRALFFSGLSKVKWYLLSYVQQERLYAPLYLFRNMSIAIYILILIIALIGARFLVHSIIPRLKRGADYAEAVASGDISGRLDDARSDELGRMFRAINTMVEHLKKAIDTAKIQEQRATEASDELFMQNSRLEMTVEERTMELEEAQRHTRLILDLTTEAVFELDEQGFISFANSTAQRMLGYEESEMLNRDFFETVRHHPDGGLLCESDDCRFQKAVKSNERENLHDIWIVDKNENSIPVSVSVSPIIKYGVRVGTIIAIIDLTEVMQTTKMMQALYDSTEEGYMFFSETFEPLDCNAALIKLFKAPSKQHILENFQSFSPPFQKTGCSSEEEAAQHQQLTMRNGIDRFEWTHVDVAGREIPCYITIMHVQVNKQKMNISNIHDLSDQKKAEQALTEQREQLQEILDSSPTTMAIIRDGVIRKVNDNGTAMLGLQTGDSARKIYVDLEQRKKALSSIGLGAQVKNWPMRMYNTNGEILDTLMSLHPFVYEGKASLLAWISDVTELTRAKVLAEEAAKAKSDFLASMSHEIRTPMNAILGMTHLCIQTNPDEKQMNYLVKIQKAANVLLSIINDILDFSKIESGKFTLDNTPFRLREILKSLWDLVAFRAEEKGVAFAMNVADDLPDVFMGDPLRLNQILVNLCNNSIKFTEHGRIALDISSKEIDGIIDGLPAVEILFTVTDTGIGMTEEQVKRLFKPFTQADGSITRKYGGSGLGLSISKYLVESMDGRIWVESVHGEGSSFHFTIKLGVIYDYEEQGLALPKFDAPNEEAGERAKIKANVLLVEDNEINQEIAIEMLSQFGATVEVAANGAEALTMLREAAPLYDIVFMDVQMPIMDGLEATRRIRGDLGYARNELPIIAMTAHAMKGDYEKSLNAGMNDHITKPIDPNELYETLKTWAGNARKNNTP